jgi:Transposase DDE domain
MAAPELSTGTFPRRRATTGHRGARRAAKRGRNTKAATQVGRAARAATRRANGRTRAERRRRREARQAAPVVYGDSAYGSGEFLSHLVSIGIDPRVKTQPPVAPEGRFAKDRFEIDLETDTVTCPAGHRAPIRRHQVGDGLACFGEACACCPLRSDCTTAEGGRTISVSRHEALLAEARERAEDPDWARDYRATRPKVERKLGHLMRRRHGGRRARVRGKKRVDADFNLLAAAQNLARLAVLGLRSSHSGTWVLA